MTNPSPKTPKERAEDREKHSANTFFRRAILDTNNIQGRFAGEEASKVIGAGAAYPPTVPGSPWNSAVISEMNRASDPTGHDTLAAPVVGEPFEQTEAAEIERLRKELNRLSYEMKIAPLDDTERLDAIQDKINVCQRELERMRQR